MPAVGQLRREQLIRRPRAEVFEFFSNAHNLEAITPPFLRFKILTPAPIEMRPGALIDYRLRLSGIWFRWQTRIETFEPPLRFSDTQVRGPYRSWVHVHEFVETPEGTLMTDTVDYALPLGPLGALAHRLFVRRQVATIFDYRSAKIEELLAVR